MPLRLCGEIHSVEPERYKDIGDRTNSLIPEMKALLRF